ncbi:hypothetical protein QFC21_000788 [Naganishia friedmannii]|uniref:Uncharacterized protein n=1 Tax=Naganishia friedmannii TaxID=89922 RepID=A0ACC2W786_9TREE|nr:hypothetical protein QFC21_000788 [Naganishia friedmannii]
MRIDIQPFTSSRAPLKRFPSRCPLGAVVIHVSGKETDDISLSNIRENSSTFTSPESARPLIQIADVDPETGVALKTGGTTVALCGQVRAMGEADDSINRIATRAGALRNVWSYQK